MTFSSQLEARQFLIAKITNQASRTATALSDAEHRMLQLNLNQPASAAGIPVEMLEDKSGSYEEKMANLLRSAYDRDDKAPEEQQKYREALRTLHADRGDHGHPPTETLWQLCGVCHHRAGGGGNDFCPSDVDAGKITATAMLVLSFAGH